MSPSNLFFEELHHIFGTYGDCVVPDSSEIEERLAKHRNLPDTCFHVLDLRKGQLTHVHGTERIFGIEAAKFSYASIKQLIHPAYLSMFLAKALATYRSLGKYTHTIHPNRPYYYNIFLPMKLRDGKYYRVRQMSMPFGLDANNNMVLQLNIYRTGFEEYDGQPLTSYFSSTKDYPLDGQTQQMKKDHVQALHEDIFVNFPQLAPKHKDHWNFTPRELELLTLIAKNPEMGFAGAADKMFIGIHRARGIWLKGGIKEKVNAIFYPRTFNTIQEVASFLAQMDVLRVDL